ncbi:hypothetical protein GQX74_002686 [Glossina fuscipes]|nr:hypothetical protein GQX74_002686 [Glossina fuscipes]
MGKLIPLMTLVVNTFTSRDVKYFNTLQTFNKSCIKCNRTLPVLKYEQHVHYSRSVYIQYGLSWSVTYQQILRLSPDLLPHSLLKQFIILQNKQSRSRKKNNY